MILRAKVVQLPGPRTGSSRCPFVANAENANGISFVAPWDLGYVKAPCGRGLAGIPLVPGHKIVKVNRFF